MMSKNFDGRAVTVSVKIYEWLLLAYPPSFRQRFGSEMKQLFLDQCRDAWCQGAGWALAGLWLRVLLDWTKTILWENIEQLTHRPALVRVFGLVLAGAFLCSVLLANFSPHSYTSVTLIHVRELQGADPYFVAQQSKIIKSYSVLTNVIINQRLHVILAEQNGVKRWTIDQAYDYLSKRISIKQPTRMKGVLRITVNNLDPTFAARIANGIVSSYLNLKQQNDRLGKLPESETVILDPARAEWKSRSRSMSAVLPAWAFGAALLMWGVFFRLLPKLAHY
jgi:capsular polysaccharide biosynthesis protein